MQLTPGSAIMANYKIYGSSCNNRWLFKITTSHGILESLFLGFIAGIPLLIGCVVSLFANLSKSIITTIMAFGSGVNIFVNSPKQTKYFYQDLDKDGLRLNGSGRYTVTFARGHTPPVYGFWSLTLYNKHHFFVSNEINRYSIVPNLD